MHGQQNIKILKVVNKVLLNIRFIIYLAIDKEFQRRCRDVMDCWYVLHSLDGDRHLRTCRDVTNIEVDHCGRLEAERSNIDRTRQSL